jgi:serine/threonine protein kinase
MSNSKFKIDDFIFDPSKDEIGHGKYGYVYKVKYKYNNSIYALKVVKIRHNNNSQLKEIWREFQILSNSNHENIVKFYGYFNEFYPPFHEICHFFILEFIDGENLKVMLERYKKLKKPISQELIIKILTEIVKGLNYLHKNNILQRDLAPDNIMINKNNNIKITDFGISAFYSDQSNQEKTVVGREIYSSPEIFNASLGKKLMASYNSKTDIFSLGVIMFLLMTFNYPSLLIERNIKNININEYKDCIDKELYDKNLINIVMSMLEIQENKRPSCEEILYSLERIENDKYINIDKQSSFTCAILCLSNIDKIYQYLIENKRNQKKIKENSFIVVQNFCEILKKTKEIKCLDNNFINKFIEDISQYIILFEEKNITPESIFKTFFDYDIEFNEKGKKISDLLNQYEEKHYYLNNGKNKISCAKCGKMLKFLYEIKSIYNSPEVFIFHFDKDVQLEEFIKIKVSSGIQSSEIYNLQTIIFEKQINNEIMYEIAIRNKETWIYYSNNESKNINVKDLLNKGNVCTAFYALSSNEFSIL